jgi:hypothetical protein
MNVSTLFNRFRRIGAALLLAAVALPAFAQHAGHPDAAAPKVKKAPPPALGSGVAFGPDGRLWWTGLDGEGRLFLRASADEGRSWSEPQILPTGNERISADGENRPKIAFSPTAAQTFVISYTQPLAKPYTGAIRLLRSTDGGRSFAAPITVHQDRQVITHRFESIGFDAQGRLHAVWIDKRDLEAAKAAGRKDYRGAAIYRNVSSDGGATFGPDVKVADHSCECCRIALAPTPDGGLAALWRHVFAPNQRDHAFARLDGSAAAEPVRASLDRWAIDACPHHGPGLAPATDGGWHAVWFGQRNGAMAVRYGRLAADGRPAGEARVLPDEAAEHADVASAGERVVIVWRSFDGRQTRLRAWTSEDGGQRFTLQELGATALPNDHPRLLQRGGRFLVFWRSSEGARVETL